MKNLIALTVFVLIMSVICLTTINFMFSFVSVSLDNLIITSLLLALPILGHSFLDDSLTRTI